MLLHLCCNIKCTSSMEQGDAVNPLQTQLQDKVDCKEHSMFMLHVTGTGFCTMIVVSVS